MQHLTLDAAGDVKGSLLIARTALGMVLDVLAGNGGEGLAGGPNLDRYREAREMFDKLASWQRDCEEIERIDWEMHEAERLAAQKR